MAELNLEDKKEAFRSLSAISEEEQMIMAEMARRPIVQLLMSQHVDGASTEYHQGVSSWYEEARGHIREQSVLSSGMIEMTAMMAHTMAMMDKELAYGEA